jgi:hypothetical protein
MMCPDVHKVAQFGMGLHATDVPKHDLESLGVRVVAPEIKDDVVIRVPGAGKWPASALSRGGMVDRLLPRDPAARLVLHFGGIGRRSGSVARAEAFFAQKSHRLPLDSLRPGVADISRTMLTSADGGA